ncbi:DUF5615 family PIN-like protein [Rhodoplanes roseus]|uniref:DUF5615 domain-containing protein n=1 Tax=Rhodoplanes roseus TaxID=29409 RepID=A0A327L040_9BRAD|nr:DUF5615 family PIN-like protein [Rhodoplanes roseus]RAI43285.1 hypothetical protein CH341_15160 [Rhodoplanes roseus]
MNGRLLIDECLSVSLVAVAKTRGIHADHVTWLVKSGWQDRNLAAFALDNDYVVVTNNRRHFLREYANLSLHCGLIVVVPAAPRTAERALLGKALDVFAELDGDLVNMAVEVLEDGRVLVRTWCSAANDRDHIDDPTWR